MKHLLENWRLLMETEGDFKPHMMYDPNSDKKEMTKKKEDHERLGKQGYVHVDPADIRKVLKDEGGASGMDPFLKAIDASEESIKAALAAMNDVGQHVDGDYILADDKEVNIEEIIKEEIRFVLEKRKKKKKKKSSGKKDACYHKVKSRYAVWPSAYASGALVKCRKVGAKNWGNKSKKK
jgi:hypothetical protein